MNLHEQLKNAIEVRMNQPEKPTVDLRTYTHSNPETTTLMHALSQFLMIRAPMHPEMALHVGMAWLLDAMRLAGGPPDDLMDLPTLIPAAAAAAPAQDEADEPAMTDDQIARMMGEEGAEDE